MLACAMPASAGQVFSGVGFEDGPASASVQSSQAGATVQSSYSGFSGRAMTDYGVNRIAMNGPYDPANPASENALGSVWAETFTAQGSGMVRVSMNFTIDGSANFLNPPGSPPEFNYYVQILKGVWNLSLGDDFGDLNASVANAVPLNGRTYSGATQLNLSFGDHIFTEFEGVSPQGDVLNRTVERFGSTVVVTNYSVSGVQEQRFLPDRLVISNNGVPGPTILYSQNPTLLASYQAALAANPVLARGALCNDGDLYQFNCGSGEYEPWTMMLEFDVEAGSQFTVFSALIAEQVSGSLDFFNTARLSSLTATGGTLSSANAAFQALPGGGYGFLPAAAGVPEPTTWAMLILGFGLIGGALRRRTERTVLA